MIGSAEVSFYNHAYVKAFNSKLIEIWIRQYFIVPKIRQNFGKTTFKENVILGYLPKLTL